MGTRMWCLLVNASLPSRFFVLELSPAVEMRFYLSYRTCIGRHTGRGRHRSQNSWRSPKNTPGTSPHRTRSRSSGEVGHAGKPLATP